ncbi:MAG: succinyldiaminopimelate transaminase [Candidatus Parcubacteria bacterium]|nr:succinyldiaminopimelate transaminase [Burkholderiales bacterium]
MNPRLCTLQTYPFDKLRGLLAGIVPNPALKPIDLSIGEPKHPTPALVKNALTGALDGLAVYPRAVGLPELREAIAGWAARRYSLPALDPVTQVLPVNGTREALFAFAQTVIDPAAGDARVVSPNPFYQIYEGAALLAGAQPLFLNNGMRYGQVDWKGVQLIYVCSPGNPTGRVMSLDEWQELFELSDRHGFIIASDECYSEIYLDEGKAPLGALDAAHRLGRKEFTRLVMFSSLSKRSNAPGMRSGFVAGDAALLKQFLLYRTYHGSAMSVAVQRASIAAWNDEAHVRENRRLYAQKFAAVLPLIHEPLKTEKPDGGFYLWIRTPVDDGEFARGLQRDYNVLVLPGSFLAREAHGENPGKNHVRIALVAPLEECVDAAGRIMQFAKTL